MWNGPAAKNNKRSIVSVVAFCRAGAGAVLCWLRRRSSPPQISVFAIATLGRRGNGGDGAAAEALGIAPPPRRASASG